MPGASDDELIQAVKAGAAAQVPREEPASAVEHERRYPALRAVIRLNRALTWTASALGTAGLIAGVIASVSQGDISGGLGALIVIGGLAVIALAALSYLAFGEWLQVQIDIEANTRQVVGSLRGDEA